MTGQVNAHQNLDTVLMASPLEKIDPAERPSIALPARRTDKKNLLLPGSQRSLSIFRSSEFRSSECLPGRGKGRVRVPQHRPRASGNNIPSCPHQGPTVTVTVTQPADRSGLRLGVRLGPARA